MHLRHGRLAMRVEHRFAACTDKPTRSGFGVTQEAELVEVILHLNERAARRRIDMVSQQHVVGNGVAVTTHQNKYSCRLKLSHQLDAWLQLRVRARTQDKRKV